MTKAEAEAEARYIKEVNKLCRKRLSREIDHHEYWRGMHRLKHWLECSLEFAKEEDEDGAK